MRAVEQYNCRIIRPADIYGLKHAKASFRAAEICCYRAGNPHPYFVIIYYQVKVPHSALFVWLVVNVWLLSNISCPIGPKIRWSTFSIVWKKIRNTLSGYEESSPKILLVHGEHPLSGSLLSCKSEAWTISIMAQCSPTLCSSVDSGSATKDLVDGLQWQYQETLFTQSHEFLYTMTAKHKLPETPTGQMKLTKHLQEWTKWVSGNKCDSCCNNTLRINKASITLSSQPTLPGVSWCVSHFSHLNLRSPTGEMTVCDFQFDSRLAAR